MNNDDVSTWSLRRAERASVAHALGARLAHDLGTPLNVILGRASLIADDPAASDELRAHAAVINRQVRALHELISGFVGTVRAPYEGVERAQAELGPIAEGAARSIAPLAARCRVEVTVDTSANGSARLEPLLALHAVSAALAHAVSIAKERVRVSTDVVEVARPQARRCAPGTYGRFVIEGDANAPGDPDLALAACEGSLRFLGGYLGVGSPEDALRYEICLPVR
jgi:signal transduction histidine kinase